MATMEKRINVMVDVNVNGRSEETLHLVDARHEWEAFTRARGGFAASVRAVGPLFGRHLMEALREAALPMEELAIDMHTAYERALEQRDAVHERKATAIAEQRDAARREIRELEHLVFRIVEDVRKRHADLVEVAGSAVVPPWFRRAAALGRDHSEDGDSVTEPNGWVDPMEEPF